MKVLVIHNKYLSKYIGGEDLVYIEELDVLRSKLGFDNVVFYEVSNDTLSWIDLFKLSYQIWFSWNHYHKIKNLIRERDIKIVHVHNYFPILTPSIFKAAKECGCKVIHTLHNYRLWCIAGTFFRNDYGICEICTRKRFPLAGFFNKCYRNSYFHSLVAQLAFSFYRLSKQFEYIDYFFVLTNFQLQKVKYLGIEESKIKLKPNGVRYHLVDEILQSKINPTSKMDYIFVGRLEESKGILQLLHTWEKLNQRFILHIVGDGPLGTILREKYKNLNNIIFHGKQDRKSTLKKIFTSKYLICPSIWYETFGLVIIESMLLKTPVIGFSIGTRTEFIKHEFNGFLCDLASLELILETSFDYPYYAEMCENCRKFGEQYFLENIIEDQIDFYKKILGEY
ncbi:MAG: glycosyltransferase [Candidatus Aenigmatarchaeota archaeon]